MLFCWMHKWTKLDVAFIDKPKTGPILKEYFGFLTTPKYFANITGKHPAYGDFIKLQKELLDTALQNEGDASINIPLQRYAEDKMCTRCGMHVLKLQKEIKIYYEALNASVKLKDKIRNEAETALNNYWNQDNE